MKPIKLNKLERRANRAAMMKEAMSGEGLYVYANNTKGELDLPKSTASGKKRVMPGEQFQGDNYFMQLVRSHDLRFIREIISPEQERQQMAEQKLLLDQPDRVTNQGHVEHVVENPKKQLNEGQPNKEQKPVLLTEDPMDGVEILLN